MIVAAAAATILGSLDSWFLGFWCRFSNYVKHRVQTQPKNPRIQGSKKPRNQGSKLMLRPMPHERDNNRIKCTRIAGTASSTAKQRTLSLLLLLCYVRLFMVKTTRNGCKSMSQTNTFSLLLFAYFFKKYKYKEIRRNQAIIIQRKKET